MESKKSYQPISCVFYDLIEHHATRKEIVKIEVQGEESVQIFHSKILDTRVKDKVEYMIIETPALSIRMDQIISLNDEKLADYGPNC